MTADPPATYGDERYASRRELRAVVWNIAQGRCEHPTGDPTAPVPCNHPATELAHVQPRGMGHTGYRDTVNNAMAACPEHARSTDNLTHPAWSSVPPPHDRPALAAWLLHRRRADGWAV